MTQYLLSVWHSDDNPVPDRSRRDAEGVRAGRRVQRRAPSGRAWVFAGGLHEPSSATVVSATDGDPIMTDGPFAETKEQLGGFWIIEAPDLDAALAWAAKGSTACMGPVEVRPFQSE